MNFKNIRTIVAWNRIHPETLNASFIIKHLLKEIHLAPHSVYDICKPNGLDLITRLKLGLSHLTEYKFNHNLKNCINPLFSCSLEVESTSYFFLHCHYYDSVICKMFNELCEVDVNLPNAFHEKLVNILLDGSSFFVIVITGLFILINKCKTDSNRFSRSIF